MRLARKLFTAFTLIAVLSACSSEASSPMDSPPLIATASAAAEATPAPAAVPTACPPTPLEVTMTYELVTDSSGGVTINVESNLPEGSLLNADFFIEGGFLAQDDGVLEDGKISFGPFSDKGTPLQGTYDMSVTAPIAGLQPEAVQTCIGAAGEQMTGPLVSTDDITGDNFAGIDTLVTIE